MSDLRPDEQEYLAGSRRCGNCNHLTVLHSVSSTDDTETYCEIPGCECRQPWAAVFGGNP